MGKLEKRNKGRTVRKNLQKIILETIATSGAVATLLVAPNVLGAMAKLGITPSKTQKDSIRKTRSLLVKKGFLSVDKKRYVHLTTQGECALQKMTALENGLKKPLRWDGKWRVLIFDIPEKRKAVRARLRHSLSAVGFVLLQDSVWIYPYNCEDFVTLLKVDFKIGKEMRYMIVDEIEGDELYRRLFNLRIS